MAKRNKDPFGGVAGQSEDVAPSPFKIDKNQALKEIQISLDIWDQKNLVKKSFLQSLREGRKNNQNEIKASHWNFSKKSKDYVNVHLVWSKKVIRTLANVPFKQVRVALNGLKAFYNQISSIKPDFSNPDVLLCYNETAKSYHLPEKNITFKNDIEIETLDPFAGVKGEDLEIVFNSIAKDKKIALDELDFSIEFFDQLDEIKTNKNIKNSRRKPKNFSFSYKTSDEYFDIYLYWGGKLIKSIKKVSKQRARVAIVSLKGFIKAIHSQQPDLNDPIVREMYQVSKEKYKPKLSSKQKDKKILSIEEGGYSYWSNKTHRWVRGKFDKKKGIFIPPKENL
tara:strand:+ start:4464 stop:5477 length:1014 start_codon:yes stop_codon:yes gene_type:complete